MIKLKIHIQLSRSNVFWLALIGLTNFSESTVKAKPQPLIEKF